MMGPRAAVQVVIAVIAVACGPIAPLPVNGALPGDFDIHVENGTILVVSIFVNDEIAVVVPGRSDDTLFANQLPALPWRVEARSASGRVLTSVDVRADSVQRHGNEIQTTGARLDLSCGRLDIYIATPLMGPMPGPGVPGDCHP